MMCWFPHSGGEMYKNVGDRQKAKRRYVTGVYGGMFASAANLIATVLFGLIQLFIGTQE